MKWLVAILVCTFPGSLFAAEPKFSAKVEKVAMPDGIAEEIRKLLDEQALVVRDGENEVMTVWFLTQIPVLVTAEQVKNGLTYREIPEGTLIGAVSFPARFTDFRKQEIPAGVYTLRFAIQPDIGDHTGTAPNVEFFLMCPAKKDTSAKQLEPKKVIELSSVVNEGRHPAVLMLWPHHARDAGVKVVDKGEGVYAATITRTMEAADLKVKLGFAITIAGVRKE